MITFSFRSLWTVALMMATLYILPAHATDRTDDPYDSYSMPRVYKPAGFTSLSTVFIDNDVITRNNAFHLNELREVKRGKHKWVNWQFNRKAGSTAGATLRFKYETRVKPEKYTLIVFNGGKTDITLAAGTSREVLRSGEEKQITMLSTELWLQAADISDDKTYDLYCRELQIYYPYAAGLKTLSITSPPHAEAGKEIRFHIKTEGSTGAGPLDIEVRHSRWVIWRIRLTAEEKTALENNGNGEVVRKMPWYLASGDVTVGLVANGYRVEGKEAAIKITGSKATALPKMERRNYNGRPTFFKNGTPYNWSGYATYNFVPGSVNEFGRSGANLFYIPVAAGRHIHQVASPTWYGGNDYDFGELEQRVCMALSANPDANIVLRVSLCLPPFWFDEHPDARATVRTKNGDIVWEETGTIGPSLASTAWRQQQAEVLRELIRYVKRQPWAERVVSFFPSGEVTEEWFAWACNDNQFADYSNVNENAFAQWCRKNGYGFTRIPDPAIRAQGGRDVFPDTEEGRWAAAYDSYYSLLTAETINYFSHVIKEETQQRSLVGILYGYVIQCAGEARQSTSGNFALREILDNPDIDYITGIPLHTFRKLTGNGYDTYTSATASIQAAGKLYNNEDDLFSWLHNDSWYTEYDHNDPRGAAISMHRRVLANDAVHGASRQWFSLYPTWHYDKALQEEFARQIRLHAGNTGFDRTPTEQVAFMVDDNSFGSFTATSKYPLYSHHFMMSALARTGAPLGVWLLSDANKLPDRIKVVVVAFSPAAKKEDIAKLKTLISKGNRTIILIGATGLIDPVTGKWNTSATAQLTGLPVKIEDVAGSAEAFLPNGEMLCSFPVAAGAPAEVIRPRGYVNGEGWLKYKDGKTAGAERALANGGKLIWCGVPPYLDVPFLRKWLQEAGVHCYGPVNSFVHASKELVAITSTAEQDSTITITWPGKVKVQDLFDNWEGSGTNIACPFKAGQTRLFKVAAL
ncbi:hypothetical protein MMC2321_04241 [Chitinophaga sp. MM2321]